MSKPVAPRCLRAVGRRNVRSAAFPARCASCGSDGLSRSRVESNESPEVLKALKTRCRAAVAARPDQAEDGTLKECWHIWHSISPIRRPDIAVARQKDVAKVVMAAAGVGCGGPCVAREAAEGQPRQRLTSSAIG